MTTCPQSASPSWKWNLIISELLVAAHLLVMHFAGPYAWREYVRQETGLIFVGSSLVSLAWAFLFFGSPFLVSSQRWLAVLGWCMAAGALLFPVL